MTLTLALTLACAGPAPSDSAPPPWADAEATELSPFQEIGEVDLGPVTVTRIRFARRAALGFLIQTDGQARVVDERLRLADRPWCLDPDDLGEDFVEAWQGNCGAGDVEVARGSLALPGLVDVAIDEQGLRAWLVSSTGAVQAVELDPAAGLGFLRKGVGWETELAVTSAVYAEGALQLATAEGVRTLGEDGALGELRPYASPELLSGDGGLWLLDEEGLHGPGLSEPMPATLAAAAGGRGVAWFEGTLSWSDGGERALASEPDRLALDPRSGVAWAVHERRLRRLAPEVDDQDFTIDGVNAIAISDTHDLWLSWQDTLQAHFDAWSLVDARPPLQLTTLSFLETPASRDIDIVCDAPQVEGALAQGLDLMAANQALLVDLPGAIGIGVTPRVAEAAVHCKQTAALAALPWEAGLLTHDSSGCADADCYADFVRERLGRLRAAGLEPTWVGGATGEEDPSFDPIAVTAALGLEHRLFLSQGLRADVPAGAGLFKEPWPLLPGDPPLAFLASTQADLPEGRAGGDQALYPGDSVRGFAASACAGLLVQECILLSQGSDRFEPADVDALLLLALHAAARREQALSTWSWHLPNLMRFDYSAGCARGDDGLWVAEEEGCQATLLQELSWALHQELVLNGLAEWRAPSELGWP